MIIQLQESNEKLLVKSLVSTEEVEFDVLMRRLREVAPSSVVQIMDGRNILGYDHVLFAVLNALNARRNKRMICEDLALEILVYASAQRQIKNSLKMLGVRRGSKHLAVVALSENRSELERLDGAIGEVEKLGPDTSFPNSWNKERLNSVKKAFKISDAEIEATRMRGLSEREVLEKLVIERMALLSISV